MRHNLKIGFLEVNYLIIPLFIAGFYFDFLDILIIAYSSAVLHEIFHILSAKLLRIKLKTLQILPFGLSAVLDCEYVREPKNEFIVAISGPMANFLIIALCFLSGNIFCNHFHISFRLIYFIYITNISMLLINLLPILPLIWRPHIKSIFNIKMGIYKGF